ncbi:MAG TPA: zinc metalloprotease [Chitinophagaceae bacterium]|nr:zinc metalloprotease [Chitinophagaceae bacterium]
MGQTIFVLKKRMCKIILLFICQAAFYFPGLTQRSCGTSAPSPDELMKNPALRSLYDSMTAKYRSWLSTQLQRPTAVRVFPVVVHILYNNNTGDATNISDAQVFSQIDIINNDFQKLNADWTNTPAAWQGLVANCEIKFCLASKDPNGNYTNGIVRRYTDSTNFVLKPSPKHNNTGGSDAWPTDKYINIWIAPNLNNGVTNRLGYASFPWENDGVEDGIVIRHNAFGNTGTAASPYDEGRTLTHEVGHFFGLRHIWGDDQTMADRCSGSDGVDDTPNQLVSTGGCPGFPLTDSCTNANPGIMFMNYMDYTNDACMYMFTNDQKTLMDFYIITAPNRQVLLNNVNNSCGNCTLTLNLSGNSPGGGAFYKAAVINSTQNVSLGGTLLYKAGTTIRLQPGFRCINGRTLYAGMEVCYPPN